jgi:hypothetical protein
VHALHAQIGWLALLWEYYSNDPDFEAHLIQSGLGTEAFWNKLRAEALRGIDEASRFERRELDDQDA